MFLWMDIGKDKFEDLTEKNQGKETDGICETRHYYLIRINETE